MSRTGTRIAMAFALVGAAGCGSKKDDASGEAPTEAPKPPPDAAPPPTPGLVYFAVSREGVVELKGGVFRRVLRTEGRIDDVVISPSGDVFAVADAQIVRAPKDGSEEAELIGTRSAPGVARRIAAGTDDSLWAITGKGLWQRSGGEWRVDNTFPRPRTVVDIVATRAGRVVAAARDSAFIRETDPAGGPANWREVELPDPPPEPKPATPTTGGGDDTVGDAVDGADDGVDEEGSSKKKTFVRALSVGADDRVYASTSSGVYQLGDAEWKLVADEPVDALAVAADGTILAAAEEGVVVHGQPGGLAKREIASLGIAAAELDAVATDSLSRLWLATDGGWIIANSRAEPLAVFSAGSQAALPGRIVAIRVVEAPTILPEVRERRIGAVKGTLVGFDKKSIAGVEIELCARPDTLFRGSPCAEASFRGNAKTDDKGTFRIDYVPAGRYGVAIKQGEEWVVDLTLDCCTQLFAEDEASVGKIKLGL